MPLKEIIQTDLTDAVRLNKELERSVLRMLLAAVLNKEKEKRYKLFKSDSGLDESALSENSALSEEELIDVISSEVKKRKESVVEFQKGNRPDLAEKEKKEISILMKYLPEQLTEEEIVILAKQAINQTNASGIKDMGKVISCLMPQVRGKAEGGVVSQIVKNLLAIK